MAQYYRGQYIDQLLKLKDKHYIKVLTGIRRSGKSTILSQFQEKIKTDLNIKPEQIIKYDFNDPNNLQLTYLEIYNTIIKKAVKNKMNYVFLDEVQEIKEWERCVIGLYENKTINFDIYLTGSNSKMLSSELSTLLTGRHRDIFVMPLTLKEFSEITKEKDINKTFFNYSLIGGLGIIIPNIDNIQEAKKDLSTVLNDTINKDFKYCHNNTRNILIDKIIKYALSNAGKPISSTKTAIQINKSDEEKISHVSISNYLQWSVDAMLLYRVNYYNIKTKSILKTTGKYYAGDIGVLNSVIGYKDNSFGNKLENIVFLNLLSLGYEVYTAELYQKNKDNKEIDFVVFKDNGFKYIQVTHTLTEQNKKREVGNLLSIKDGFDKIILLISDETKYKVDGIKRINIVRWLMNEVTI